MLRKTKTRRTKFAWIKGTFHDGFCASEGRQVGVNFPLFWPDFYDVISKSNRGRFTLNSRRILASLLWHHFWTDFASKERQQKSLSLSLSRHRQPKSGLTRYCNLFPLCNWDHCWNFYWPKLILDICHIFDVVVCSLKVTKSNVTLSQFTICSLVCDWYRWKPFNLKICCWQKVRIVC